MPTLTYTEFQRKQFPEKSAFHRKGFGFSANLVRWIALKVAYLGFRMNISANVIDVFGVFLSLTGFLLLSTALTGEKFLSSVGALLIFFHVFLDFVNGPIPKACGTCTKIGAFLDDFGCDMDRCAVLVLLGIFTQSTPMILASVFVAGVTVFFVPYAYVEMPKEGWIGQLCRIYVHKYSFLSVRVMLWGLPLFLAIAILKSWNLQAISLILLVFYAIMASLWLFLCIPMRNANERWPPGP